MHRTAATAERRIHDAAQVLDESPRDFDALIERARGRCFVLLGEASHGTDEFYGLRAAITRPLLEELDFDAVAVEGDWPDTLRLDAYVRGQSTDTLVEAFGDFQRFPTWMWRNTRVREFIDWLHGHNAARSVLDRVGVYGMDVYSLYRSAEAVIGYLEGVDPEQARLARHVYACLDHIERPQDYAWESARGLRPDCSEGAVALLVSLLSRAPQYLEADGREAAEALFHAERNAHVVLNAERYYREMFGGHVHTWNLRDAHMGETLFALRKHLHRQGRAGRIVVWAHNSHLGDARATAMGERGEWNVGQLVREQAGADNALLVGFTTYTGHVTAARDWDEPAERRWVRPAPPGSIEHLMHASRRDRFYLDLQHPDLRDSLAPALPERAIGVVYRPETERQSHYFDARLSRQFDVMFHIDETTALEPFDIGRHWQHPELPDTWPSGL